MGTSAAFWALRVPGVALAPVPTTLNAVGQKQKCAGYCESLWYDLRASRRLECASECISLVVSLLLRLGFNIGTEPHTDNGGTFLVHHLRGTGSDSPEAIESCDGAKVAGLGISISRDTLDWRQIFEQKFRADPEHNKTEHPCCQLFCFFGFFFFGE